MTTEVQDDIGKMFDTGIKARQILCSLQSKYKYIPFTKHNIYINWVRQCTKMLGGKTVMQALIEKYSDQPSWICKYAVNHNTITLIFISHETCIMLSKIYGTVFF